MAKSRIYPKTERLADYFLHMFFSFSQSESLKTLIRAGMQDQRRSIMSEAPKQHSDYPVSESYKVLEGYDIYRSAKLIVALVVVESDFGKDLRMYRWQKRGDAWKVDLCRMSVASWRWDEISAKARELTEKYQLKRKQAE
jgi:hypothetical protein